MVREVTVESIRTPARPSAASATRSYIPVASSSRLPPPARSSTARKRSVLGESDLDNLTPKIAVASTKRKLGPPSRSRHSHRERIPASPAMPRETQRNDMDLTSTFNFGSGDETMLMDIQPPSSVSGLSSPPEPLTTARPTGGGSKYVRGSRIGESRMMTPLPSQEHQKRQAASPSENTPRVSRLPTPPSSSPEDRSSTTQGGNHAHALSQDSPARSTYSSLARIEQKSPNPRSRKVPRIESSRRGASLGSPLLPSNNMEAVTPRTMSHAQSSSRAPATARGPKRSSTSYLTPSSLGTPREAKGKQRAVPATAPVASRKPRQSTARKSPAKTVPAKRRNSTPHTSGGRRKSVTPLVMLALSGRKLGFLEERIPIEPGEDPLLLKGPEEDEVCRWPRMSSANRKKLQDMSQSPAHVVENQAGPSTLGRQALPSGSHATIDEPALHSSTTGSGRLPRHPSPPQDGLESGPYDFDMGGDDHFDVGAFDAPNAWNSDASDGAVDESRVGQDTFLHVLERNGGATSTPRRTTPMDEQSRLLSASPMFDNGDADVNFDTTMASPALPADIPVSPAPSVGQRAPASPAPSVGQRLPVSPARSVDQRIPVSPAPFVGQRENNDDSESEDNETIADDTVIAEEESFFGSSATIVVPEQGGDSLESLEEVETSMLQSTNDQMIEKTGLDADFMSVDRLERTGDLAPETVTSPKWRQGVGDLVAVDGMDAAVEMEDQSLDHLMNIINKVITPQKEERAVIDSLDAVDQQPAEEIIARSAPETPEISFKSERPIRRSSSRLSFTFELAEKSTPDDQPLEPTELDDAVEDGPSLTESQESVDESLFDIDEPMLAELEASEKGPIEDAGDVSEEDEGDSNEDEEEIMLNDPHVASTRGGTSPDVDEADHDHSTREDVSGDVTMEADSAEWDMSEASFDHQDSDSTPVDQSPNAGDLAAVTEPSVTLEVATVDTSPDEPQKHGATLTAEVVMAEPDTAAEEVEQHLDEETPLPTENSASQPAVSEQHGITSSSSSAQGALSPSEQPNEVLAEPEPAPQPEKRICLRLIHKYSVKVEPTVPPTDLEASATSPPSGVAGGDPTKTPIATEPAQIPDTTVETTSPHVPAHAETEAQPVDSVAINADASFDSNTSIASNTVVDIPTPSAPADSDRPARPLPPVFRFPRNNSPRGVSTSPIELMHTSRVKQPSRLSQFVTALTEASPEKGVGNLVETQAPASQAGASTAVPEASAPTISVLRLTACPANIGVSTGGTHAAQTATDPNSSTSLGLSGLDANTSSSSSGSSIHPSRSGASLSFRSLADEMAVSSFSGMSSWRPFDSSLIEVSSLDPRAAARAAAILKMNHAYIQDGVLPSTPSAASIPLPITPSTTTSARGRRRTPRPFESPYFETIELSQQLNDDELLHEAELEIVASLRHRSRSRGRSQALGDGYSSDGTEIAVPGGWRSSAKKRKRSMSIAPPVEAEFVAKEHSEGLGLRPWGVREWKKLEKVYRYERKAWTRNESVARSPSTSWLSWATSKLSTSTSSCSEWDAERVVKRFIEVEKAQGGVGEWAEHVIRLRVKALEKRVNRKGTGRSEDEHDQKRRRIDVHTPQEPFQVESVDSIAPPSTIQRMLSSFWSSASRSSLDDSTVPQSDTAMPSSQSLQAVTSASRDLPQPTLPDSQSASSSEPTGPAMRQVGSSSATMTTPIKFQPAHPSSPAWSPALAVPGAMPRSPRRRPPPMELPKSVAQSGSTLPEIPTRQSPASATVHTPVTIHATSSNPDTRTKPLYPPLYPALSQRSEPIRTLFETPASSKTPSSVPVPIAIPRGRNPSPSVKQLARSFEDEGVLSRMYKGKGKESEGALRRVQSRDL